MARRNDHTREQIKELALMAAEEIIDQQGLNSLTARGIARKMNYTVGTLYLVFENLSDLIVHVNGRTLDMLRKRLDTVLTSSLDQHEKLALLVNEYIDFAHQNKQRWICLYTYNLPMGNELPIWYAGKISALFVLIEEQLAILNRHKSRALIRSKARALWCSVHGICVLSVSGKLEAAGIPAVSDIAGDIVNVFNRDINPVEGKVA